MQFCPFDGTLLQVTGEELRFFCPVCPYMHVPRKKHTATVPTNRKRVDDVFNAQEALKGVDTTTIICPNCGHDEAGHYQVQIRSADEPMTTFYTCTKCFHRWRDQ